MVVTPIPNSLFFSFLSDHPVATSWVIAEDTCDDIFEVSYKLPLFVETYNLNFINNEVLSVRWRKNPVVC